ncbi:ADOP family duplicated permease [Acidicapsa dinghuensis]|uniref:ADOP family duplicated permease n=1 Tax=Acidicapsa dinghuensis TaxID=2218256 RepID=A0ABW1EM47_9BACT|nr:ABC transporter permease [Acidicapsa dinghuensis]
MNRHTSGKWRSLLGRTLALFRKRELDEDLDEELRSHLAHAVEENVRQGMTRNEARRQAMVRFGGVAQTREAYRTQRGLPVLDTLGFDLRYAFRQLRKSPGFTGTVVLTLTLGIGAVTAVFSVVQGVLLHPYPFRDPSRVVVLRETVRELEKLSPLLPVNYLHYANLRKNAHTIEDAAIFQNDGFSVAVDSEVANASDESAHPRETEGLNVSPTFFSVLGVTPILGRTFTDEETQPGKDNEAILTWPAWQRYFHGDPSVLNRTLRIDGVPTAIVGVLPPSFRFPVVSMLPNESTFGSTDRYEIFRPFVVNSGVLDETDGDYDYLAIARLHPGVTMAQAQSELDGLDKAYAVTNKLGSHVGVAVEPFAEEITGSYRKPLWMLFAAVFAVLLMACVNLANLQIARGVARSHETMLRSALGADKMRLLRGLLLENLLLGVAGGLGGVLCALAAETTLLTAAASLPRVNEVHLSAPMLAIAVLVSVITSIAFGIFPALRSLRVAPQSALQMNSGRVANTRDAANARRVLVAVEVACSVTLLIVTALITRSFAHLLTQERHFNADHLMMAKAELSTPRYLNSQHDYHDHANNATNDARNAVMDRALERLRSLPGAQAVALTGTLPLSGDSMIDAVERPDYNFPPGQTPLVNRRYVSPGYFKAMGIPLLEGREFAASDERDPHVVILSEKAAKTAFPDASALGRTILRNGQKFTVVGIAADARINDLKRDPAICFVPYWANPPYTPVFLVRSAEPEKALGPAMRNVIWNIDPDVSIPTVMSLDMQVSESVATDRFQALLLSGFGAAALFLAVLGIYGVLAYSVSMRTQEFGIRIALGSNRSGLVRLVLRDASYPLIGGILIGLLASAAATRWIRSLLYETSAVDPWAVAMSLALLLIAALVASLIPLRKVTKVDPMQALRSE